MHRQTAIVPYGKDSNKARETDDEIMGKKITVSQKRTKGENK